MYQISCNNCEAIYIGQCGRCLKNRIKEHKKSISDGKRSTGFAEHCIDLGHELDDSNIKILRKCSKGPVMTAWENLEIKKAVRKNVFVTNEITDLGNSPLITVLCKI